MPSYFSRLATPCFCGSYEALCCMLLFFLFLFLFLFQKFLLIISHVIEKKEKVKFYGYYYSEYAWANVFDIDCMFS